MALIFIILAIIFAVLAINLFSSANKHESRYNNTSKATNKKATSNGQSSANVATPPVVIVKSYWDAYKEKQASKAKVIENLWGLDFSKLSDKDVREKISSTERLSNNLTKVSHLPFYWLSRIIKHCNILIDNLLTFRK